MKTIQSHSILLYNIQHSSTCRTAPTTPPFVDPSLKRKNKRTRTIPARKKKLGLKPTMDIEPAPKEDLNSNKLSISFLLNSGERDTTLAETTTTIETNTTAWPWGPQETTNSNKDSEIDPSGELASSGLFLLAETTTTTPYLAGEKRRRKDDATRSAKRSKKEQEGFRLIAPAPTYKGETDGLGLIADLVAGQTQQQQQQQQQSAELPPLQPSATPSYVLLPSLSNSVKERPRSPPYNNNNIDNIFSTGPWNAPSNPFFPPPIFSAGATSAFTPCTTQSLASPFPVSEVTADPKSRAGPKKGSASGPQIIRFSATPSTTTGLLNLVMGQQEQQQEQQQQQQQPQQCNQGKRNRWNSYQKAILEETFQDDPWPDAATKEQIAVKISMTPAQVATWFQNKRARNKEATAAKEKKRKWRRRKTAPAAK